MNINVASPEIRATLRIQAASGCPALSGNEVPGAVLEKTVRCEGNGSRICTTCQIRGSILPISGNGR